MPEILERMLRAARLDAGLIDDLESDPGSLRQAFLAAAIVAVTGGLGAALSTQFVVLPLMAIAWLAAWLLTVALVWVLGTRLLAEPATHAEFGDVVRALGFAAAPGVLHLLAVLPVVGRLASPAANVWTLAAAVVLLRRVLSYAGWGRALAVVVIAWAIAGGLMYAGVMLSPAGAIFSAPDAPPPSPTAE